MTLDFRPTIVGNTEVFLYTGFSTAGVPENIEGQTLIFSAVDDYGNEIRKTTTDDEIVILSQTGSTFGQAGIPIAAGDYPDAWRSLCRGEVRRTYVCVERRNSTTGEVLETQHGIWELKGQGIV
jgi:hypothetical protein